MELIESLDRQPNINHQMGSRNRVCKEVGDFALQIFPTLATYLLYVCPMSEPKLPTPIAGFGGTFPTKPPKGFSFRVIHDNFQSAYSSYSSCGTPHTEEILDKTSIQSLLGSIFQISVLEYYMEGYQKLKLTTPQLNKQKSRVTIQNILMH